MEAAEEGGLAGFGGAQTQRTADEADLAMTEDGEMLNGFIDAGVVVDGEDVAEGTCGRGIDEDDGDVVDGKAIEEEIFDAKGHDGDAVDFAFEHAAGAEFHGLGFVVGGADEDFVAVGYGDLLELLDEFGEEGVCNFGDDEAEEFAFAGDEGAGLGVGEVVEVGDGLPDACRENGIDGWNVVDGAGYGGDGDASASGDAPDIDLGRGGGVDRLLRTFHGVGITLQYGNSILAE